MRKTYNSTIAVAIAVLCVGSNAAAQSLPISSKPGKTVLIKSDLKADLKASLADDAKRDPDVQIEVPGIAQKPGAKTLASFFAPLAALAHPASEKALEYLGAKYKWGGTDEKDGVDCSGFVYKIYKDSTGLQLPRTALDMAKQLDKVSPQDLRSGDLVFFNTRGSAYSHVGVYLGNSRFAHAPKAGQSARIDDLSNPYWENAFDGARRPAGAQPTPADLASAINSAIPKSGAISIPAPLPALPIAASFANRDPSLLAPSSPAEAEASAKAKAALLEEKPIIPAGLMSWASNSSKPTSDSKDKASSIVELAAKIKASPASALTATEPRVAAKQAPSAFDVSAIVLDEDSGMAVALPSRRKQ